MQAVEEFEAKHIYDLPTLLLANSGNELLSSSHDLARPMNNVLISRRLETNSETSDVVNRSSERVDSTYEVISQYARPHDASQPISFITAAATDTTLPPPMPPARRNVNGLHAVITSAPKARSTVDDEDVEEHYGDAAAVASPVGAASKDKKPSNASSFLDEFKRIVDELMPMDLSITKEIHAFFDSHNDFNPSAARPAVIGENQTHLVGPALPKRRPQHVAPQHQDTHVDTQQASTYNSKLPADTVADDGTTITTISTTADAAGAGHVTSREEQRAQDNVTTTITTTSSSSSSGTKLQTALYEELPATITISSTADDIYANANEIEERGSQVPSKMHDVPSSVDPPPLPSAYHPPRPEKKVISTKQLSNNGVATAAASPSISESMPCLSISSPTSSLSPAAVDRDNKVKVANDNNIDDGTVIATSNNSVISTASTPVATPKSAPFAGKANTIGRVNNMKWQQEMTTSTAKDQHRPSADELSIGSSSSTVKKSLFNWRKNKFGAATNNTYDTETGGPGLNSGADKSATISRSTLSLSAGKKKDKHGDGGGGDAPGSFRRVMVSLFKKKTSSADKVKVSANPKHVSAVGNQYTDAPVKQQQQSSTDVDVGHDIYYQIHAGNEPSLSQLPPLLESEYQDVAVRSSASSQSATADVGTRQSSVIDNDLYQDILTTLPSPVTTADKVGSVFQADGNRNNSNSRSAVQSVSAKGQVQGKGQDQTITTRVENNVVSPVAKKPSMTKSAPQALPFHNQQHQQVQEQPEQYQSEIYEKLQYELAASSVNNNNNNIKLSGDVSAASSSMDNSLYYQDHNSVRDSHEYAFLNELTRAADVVAT